MGPFSSSRRDLRFEKGFVLAFSVKTTKNLGLCLHLHQTFYNNSDDDDDDINPNEGKAQREG